MKRALLFIVLALSAWAAKKPVAWLTGKITDCQIQHYMQPRGLWDRATSAGVTGRRQSNDEAVTAEVITVELGQYTFVLSRVLGYTKPGRYTINTAVKLRDGRRGRIVLMDEAHRQYEMELVSKKLREE